MDNSTKALFVWAIDIGKSRMMIDEVVDRLKNVIEELKQDPSQRDNQTGVEWSVDQLVYIMDLIELDKLEDLT